MDTGDVEPQVWNHRLYEEDTGGPEGYVLKGVRVVLDTTETPSRSL